jgi:hypothetical protein
MRAINAPPSVTRAMRRGCGLPALIAAVLVVACAPAEGATFGPDLAAATANYPYPCPLFQGCTLQDPFETSMELVLPDPIVHGDQTGVVTAIHVKSAATAPAQFVVVEWSGRPDEANPFPSGVMAVSQQVTLQPGINNFNTNLPVDRRLASNGFESWSVVSLSILNGSSPIPAELGGEFATTGYLVDRGRPLTEAVADLTVVPHEVSVGGLWPGRLLMSGEVTITTGQGAAGTNNNNNNKKAPTTTVTETAAAPQLTIPGVGRIKANAARLPVRCVGPTNCAGVLRIQNRSQPGATAARKAKKPKKPKTVTYASGSFSIAAGKRMSVTVRLSRDGKRAIKGHRSLRAYANATFAGGQRKSSKVTFKR